MLSLKEGNIIRTSEVVSLFAETWITE